MLEQAFCVAEDSSKFKLIIRSFQFKKLLSRRKISILNQVALLNLLTASSECPSFLLISTVGSV